MVEHPAIYDEEKDRTTIEFEFGWPGRPNLHVAIGRDYDCREDLAFLSWARKCAKGVFKDELKRAKDG